MTITVGLAGTYLIMFSGVFNQTDGAIASFDLMVNTTEINVSNFSSTTNTSTTDRNVIMLYQYTCAVSDVIVARFKNSTGTLSLDNYQLSIYRIA